MDKINSPHTVLLPREAHLSGCVAALRAAHLSRAAALSKQRTELITNYLRIAYGTNQMKSMKEEGREITVLFSGRITCLNFDLVDFSDYRDRTESQNHLNHWNHKNHSSDIEEVPFI